MSRFFIFLSVGLGVAALLAGTVAALAYGPDAERTGELEVDGLRQPVALVWDDAGSATIEAASLPDVALGLGYAHAADHAWSMTLWRRAGRGGLGAWFGADLRILDRHARALGFDALAQETYRALDADMRSVLDAYARGVNAALSQPGVSQGDAFVLMDVSPEPWRPWDALIVERVLAYLATPPPATDSTWVQAARQDASLRPFLTADSTFRATLGIGGTDGARAFVAPAQEGRAFIAHQPAGTTLLPLLAPVTMRLNGQTVSVATMPGTLSMPIGWTGRDGWSVLLTSSMALEPFAGAPPPAVHSRIVERDGDEVLLAIPRDTSGLVLTAPDSLSRPAQGPGVADSASGGSGWRVRWSGFRPASDLAGFLALVTDAGAPTFGLLRGEGLRVRAGEPFVLGAPTVQTLSPAAAFVGASPDARSAEATLTWLNARPDSVSAPLPVAVLASNDISLRAAQTLRPLLRALGDRDSLDRALEVPYSFLKGWNHRYAPDAIAPSLYEQWLDSHQDYTGHLPDPADSLDVLLLPYTLRIAQASLRDEYGPNTTSWRWGRMQGDFAFPFIDARGRQAIARRFDAPEEGTGGHPGTLFPGPADQSPGTGAGPATWSAWAVIGQPRLTLRSPAARIASPDPDRFGTAIFPLGDPVAEDRPRLRLVPPS